MTILSACGPTNVLRTSSSLRFVKSCEARRAIEYPTRFYYEFHTKKEERLAV